MDSAKRAVIIDNVEYVPLEELKPPVEQNLPPTSDTIGESVPFWSFLKSPQFWMILMASCSSVLLRDDFQTMPWNQIVGQILTLAGSGAASFGLLNKVSKNLSVK